MTTLDTIKAEAIKRLDEVVNPIYSNVECSFAENLHVELRELLSSEIDRAVDLVTEEIEQWAKENYISEDEDGLMVAEKGYNQALNDLLQKLSTLTKDSK